MSDRGATRRLIESAFPLRETSIDSVHEKNVRHGHISTLHVWPARRPLAASRAVLLAALLDDPGSDGPRRDLLRRIGGDVVKKETERGEREETIGGVLHWGRESSPELARLREQVREAFGGRAPRVLDPFAGGGAIPLEAMRLGCEVTASDLNPVAWFILRCTLHYPRLMAGRTRPLPDFAVRDRPLVEAFLEAQGIRRRSDLRSHLARLGHGDGSSAQQTSFDVGRPEAGADFPWHLRAWGRRVLARTRRELASHYPTRAEFEPVKRKGRRGRPSPPPRRFKPRPPKILAPDAQGRVSVDPLNAEFDFLYLEDPRNPRWVAKPAVAYLWARTAECGDCRAEIPLLKTRWLCKRGDKRVLLAMTAREDRSGVDFGLESDVPGSRDDGAIGAGTMSRSGAECPCCGGIATMRDLRAQGRAGRLGARMTAVVIDGQEGKEYRLPREEEIDAAGQDTRSWKRSSQRSLSVFPGSRRPSPALEHPGRSRWMVTVSTPGTSCSPAVSCSRSEPLPSRSVTSGTRWPIAATPPSGAKPLSPAWRRRSAVSPIDPAPWRPGPSVTTKSAIRSRDLLSPCSGTSLSPVR